MKYQCSVEQAKGAIITMAKAKAAALSRLRLTPEAQADMLSIMAEKAANRFDFEIIARVCDRLIETKGWPDPHEFLDACRDTHNERQRRIERHKNSGRRDTFAQSLELAGFSLMDIAGYHSEISPLLGFHADLDENDIRAIVANVRAGGKLTGDRSSNWQVTNAEGRVVASSPSKPFDIAGVMEQCEALEKRGDRLSMAVARIGRAMIRNAQPRERGAA